MSLVGCWFVPFLLAVVWLAFVPLIAQTMDAARAAKEAFLFLSATAFALAAVAVSATRLGSYSLRTLIFAQLFVTCSIGVIVSQPETVSSRLTGVAALFIFAVAFLWSVIADARSRDRDGTEPK
jgi:hypothetical protein